MHPVFVALNDPGARLARRLMQALPDEVGGAELHGYDKRIAAPDEAARPDIRLTIDTPEDLMLARSVYEALEPEFGPMPPLVKIIRFLDAHPAIRQLNIGFSTTKLWK